MNNLPREFSVMGWKFDAVLEERERRWFGGREEENVR